VTRPSPAARGDVALIRHLTRFELVAAIRNPRARFFTFAFPVILLSILVGVSGTGTTVQGGEHIPMARFFTPGITAMSVIFSTLGMVVMGVTTRRELGILKRRRATPVPAWGIITAHTLAVLTIALGVTAGLLLFANVAFGVGLSPVTLVAALISVFVGALAFCGLGYALSTLVTSVDAAQPLIQIVMLPLNFISGVFFPTDQLPSWLRVVGELFPVEHLAAALHQAFASSSLGAALSPTDLGALAIWAIVGVTVAARRFVWTPSGAPA
jgi:ABC-2 type transport system permease protein